MRYILATAALLMTVSFLPAGSAIGDFCVSNYDEGALINVCTHIESTGVGVPKLVYTGDQCVIGSTCVPTYTVQADAQVLRQVCLYVDVLGNQTRLDSCEASPLLK